MRALKTLEDRPGYNVYCNDEDPGAHTFEILLNPLVQSFHPDNMFRVENTTRDVALMVQEAIKRAFERGVWVGKVQKTEEVRKAIGL